MLRNHYRFGVKRVGYMKKILGAGFSGIAATIMAVAASTMSGRSNAGAPFAAILRK